MSIRFTFLTLAALLGAIVSGNDQFVYKPTSTTPSPTALPAAHGYAHIGCWNETTGFRANGGARALRGGTNVLDEAMTVTTCLSLCGGGSHGAMQYAGLEDGRECWCGPALSIFSEKLNDGSRCTKACRGNATELCGGHLALTLYNLTSVESKTGIAWSQFSGAAGYGTLAVVTLIIAAVM